MNTLTSTAGRVAFLALMVSVGDGGREGKEELEAGEKNYGGTRLFFFFWPTGGEGGRPHGAASPPPNPLRLQLTGSGRPGWGG